MWSRNLESKNKLNKIKQNLLNNMKNINKNYDKSKF